MPEAKDNLDIFLDHECGHEEITDADTWVRYIFGWTSAVVEHSEPEHRDKSGINTVSTCLKMNDIARKVERGELTLEEGKQRIDDVTLDTEDDG